MAKECYEEGLAIETEIGDRSEEATLEIIIYQLVILRRLKSIYREPL